MVFLIENFMNNNNNDNNNNNNTRIESCTFEAEEETKMSANAKLLMRSDSDEEIGGVYLKNAAGQLIPFRRRNSVNSTLSFSSTTTSASTSSSTCSSFSLPDYYGIRVNVNAANSASETQEVLERSSSDNMSTSLSPNNNNLIRVNFVDRQKLDDIQSDLLNQISSEIDLRRQNFSSDKSVSNLSDLKLNKTFLVYLLTRLSLIDLLLLNEYDRNSEGFYLNESLYLIKRNEFMKKLGKLLMCLNRLERELIGYCKNFLFDTEFFLNLTFMVYEQCEHLAQNLLLKSKQIETIEQSNLFEMDECMLVDENENTHSNNMIYEQNLNYLISNFIIKYLPDLTQMPGYLSGKMILKFFASLFDHEFNLNANNDCEILNENLIDINKYIARPYPCLTNSSQADFKASNPLTQSFSLYLNNLNSLNYQTQDPFVEARRESDMFGHFSSSSNNIHNLSARLAFSYYSMGQFDIEKNLFDTTFQFWYDLKEFNRDFDQLMYEFGDQTPKTFKKVNASKWSTLKQQKSSPESSPKLATKVDNSNLLDDIIDRIDTLNTSNLFDSYFRIMTDLKDQYGLKPIKQQTPPVGGKENCSCCSTNSNNVVQNNRVWTVAPKLLPTNTISNCAKTRTIHSVPNFSSLSSNHQPNSNIPFEDSSIIYKSEMNLNWNRKADMRPIGTKPVSMYTTAGNSMTSRNNKYQKYINNNGPKLNDHKKPSNGSPASLLKDDLNIWNASSDHDKFVSPFTSFHYANTSSRLEEFAASLENIKNNQQRQSIMQTQLVNLKTNQHQQSGSSGRYSVAPMNYTRKASFSSGQVRSSPHHQHMLNNRQPRLTELALNANKDDQSNNSTNRPTTKTVYSIGKMDMPNSKSYNKQKSYDEKSMVDFSGSNEKSFSNEYNTDRYYSKKHSNNNSYRINNNNNRLSNNLERF